MYSPTLRHTRIIVCPGYYDEHQRYERHTSRDKDSQKGEFKALMAISGNESMSFHVIYCYHW
jgi:hypothetical protein